MGKTQQRDSSCPHYETDTNYETWQTAEFGTMSYAQVGWREPHSSTSGGPYSTYEGGLPTPVPGQPVLPVRGPLPTPPTHTSVSVGPATLGGLATKAVDQDSKWLDVVTRAAGEPRGGAIRRLSHFCRTRGYCRSAADAAALAVDLLGAESADACETVSSLLDDGWQGSLGELLQCARDI
jgi:hypothetical protein